VTNRAPLIRNALALYEARRRLGVPADRCLHAGAVGLAEAAQTDYRTAKRWLETELNKGAHNGNAKTDDN
jgi:hypothetical protein